MRRKTGKVQWDKQKETPHTNKCRKSQKLKQTGRLHLLPLPIVLVPTSYTSQVLILTFLYHTINLSSSQMSSSSNFTFKNLLMSVSSATCSFPFSHSYVLLLPPNLSTQTQQQHSSLTQRQLIPSIYCKFLCFSHQAQAVPGHHSSFSGSFCTLSGHMFLI